MKNKILLSVSAIAALTLAACGNDESINEESKTVQEEKEVTKQIETNVSIGFVTNVVENEYVEIEADGNYLQYEVINTAGIAIGNRVEITHEGKISDNKITVIDIKKETVGTEQITTGNENKKIIYLDNNGKVITNVEDFRENIKNNKEEATALEQERLAEEQKKAQDANNNVAPSEESNYEAPIQENVTSVIGIVYLGKADARTIEVLQGNEIKVMYLDNNNVSNQLDSYNVEQQLSVEVYVQDGRTIIKSIK